MARAHKRTIWGSHGRGSQTHNLGLTCLGLTNTQFGVHLAGAHTRFGAHMARAHTHNLGLKHTLFGAHLARANTLFGAHISQSQSKFILVLFFREREKIFPHIPGLGVYLLRISRRTRSFSVTHFYGLKES
jgi:hypothetical protein